LTTEPIDSSKIPPAELTPPDVLYHYTTLDAFRQILTYRKLWGTHLRYLNDRSEWLHLWDLLKAKVLEIPAPDAASVQIRHEMVGKIERYVEAQGPQENIFVTCFCKCGDLLSQWRGYGAGTDGISIGFKAKEIRDLHQVQDGFSFVKVLYDTATTGEVIRGLWADAFTKLVAEYPNNWYKSDTEIRRRLDSSENLRQFMDTTARQSIEVKHDGFRGEREWRAYRIISANDLSDVLFRTGNLGLTPYIEMDITDPASNEKQLPLISEIICGPTYHESETLYAVKSILQKIGFEEDQVPVRMASVPLR
jgi:hypothetical protein